MWQTGRLRANDWEIFMKERSWKWTERLRCYLNCIIYRATLRTRSDPTFHAGTRVDNLRYYLSTHCDEFEVASERRDLEKCWGKKMFSSAGRFLLLMKIKSGRSQGGRNPSIKIAQSTYDLLSFFLIDLQTRSICLPCFWSRWTSSVTCTRENDLAVVAKIIYV